MKPSNIQVGKTYVNRGAGRTRRKVLAVRSQFDLLAMGYKVDGSMVCYRQPVVGCGIVRWLSLSNFAAWAGKEIEL